MPALEARIQQMPLLSRKPRGLCVEQHGPGALVALEMPSRKVKASK